jgi:hypothetical protein
MWRETCSDWDFVGPAKLRGSEREEYMAYISDDVMLHTQHLVLCRASTAVGLCPRFGLGKTQRGIRPVG